ncbi:tyrosine-type recombinase/integrase [Brumimicrobium mesophilum]|uniref:tyrosine-type recombinase/integrase n=1 Tax=Brumimicrobium mesophilum TaxID=392717 RepID=UPI000D13EF19|nr:tyrosine-type recombinase/integrase [Brumimicrobium mesophilum]
MKNQFSKCIDKLQLELEYRNFSPSSVKSYCTTMSAMEKRLNKALSSITTEEFKVYLHDLIFNQKRSTSFINQHISAFKIFYSDILKNDWERIKIKRPKKVQKLPVVLSMDEVERLISVIINIKHRAMVMLLYSAGLRRSELLQIKPSDIDSENMKIHVRQGKGKKDRFTILSSKCLELLRLHYKLNRPKTYLFEPQGNEGSTIAPTSLANILKKNAQKANIKKEVSPHTLRHSFATHMLEQGVNIKLIQRFLGHTTLKTTSVYLHLTNIDLTKVKSPLESMNV